jgi:hypothetical protein
MDESRKRSLYKTISWRATASIASWIATWAVTGSLGQATLLFFIHLVVNTTLYYGHERAWNLIKIK